MKTSQRRPHYGRQPRSASLKWHRGSELGSGPRGPGCWHAVKGSGIWAVNLACCRDRGVAGRGKGETSPAVGADPGGQSCNGQSPRKHCLNWSICISHHWWTFPSVPGWGKLKWFSRTIRDCGPQLTFVPMTWFACMMFPCVYELASLAFLKKWVSLFKYSFIHI